MVDISKYLKAKKEGFNIRSRKDLKIKPNNNSADFITPNFATGCFGSCVYCVEEGTLISTPTGLIPVEQIQDGDEVIAYNDSTGQLVSSHIGLTAQREVEELIELEVEGQSIVVSLEHPFLTQRGWIKAQDLTMNDKVLCFNL